MKLIASLLLLVTSTSAMALQLPSRKYCDLHENYEARVVKQTEDRFNVGEVTRTDLAKAQLDQVDIQMQCGDILRGNTSIENSYCAIAGSLAQTYADGVSEEGRAGQRSSIEVDEANTRLLDVQAACEPSTTK